MRVQVIRCANGNGSDTIIGVFDDEEIANRVYDALEQHGDKSKTHYIDTFTLNEIKKGN